MVFEWHIFLWHVALGVLLVYMLIAAGMYGVLRKKMFAYYSLYIFFLLIYLFDKNEYNITLSATLFTRNLNWYIQVLYQFFYIWFCFSFLNYFTHFPRQEHFFKYFTNGVLILGTLVFVFTTIQNLPDVLLDYYLFFHVPISVLTLLFIVQQILRVKEKMKYFFIPGILFYVGLSLMALYLTFNPNSISTVAPITYFYLAIIIETTMFSFGLGYYIKRTFDENLTYQKKLNQAQMKLSQELQRDLEHKNFENEIERIKFNALQNQFNSHFIFNVLNSLKSFIIEKEKSEAVIYLNKYAKLMRQYLNGNNAETHSVAEELKTIKLYLEIENQRLNNVISIEFSEDTNSALHHYQIPMHIIIPYLENAIWKGLFFREDDKKLLLNFIENRDGLMIEILDNGHYNGNIISAQTETNIENSLKVAEKSIELFNQSFDSNIVVEMNQENDGGKTIILIKNG